MSAMHAKGNQPTSMSSFCFVRREGKVVLENDRGREGTWYNEVNIGLGVRHTAFKCQLNQLMSSV
jgi:hypothetical protein